MNLRLVVTSFLVFSLIRCSTAGGRLSAQTTRAELIAAGEGALNDFETDNARVAFQAALNPSLGAPDSLWAYGVQQLAQILISESQPGTADVWLRWAVRLEPDFEPDPINFLPSVAAAVRQAKRDVASGTPNDDAVQTDYRWSTDGTGGNAGTIEVAQGTPGLTVTVGNVGVVENGRSLDVATYPIAAAAEGYDSVQVNREILPGVTLVLTFDLPRSVVDLSVLPPEIRTVAFAGVARIVASRMATDSCGAGFVATGDGLLVTTYHMIRGADRIDVTLPGRQASIDVPVAAYDTGLNLAVLKISVGLTDSIPVGSSAEPGDFVWGLSYRTCAEPVDTRLQVTAAAPGLRFSAAFEAANQGGPLINRDGFVVGIPVDGDSARSATQIQALLATARNNVTAGQLVAADVVARRESQLFGLVTIRSDVTNATARVQPIEAWQWPQLARTGVTPLVFTGPMGRYRVDVVVADNVITSQDVTVEPSVAGDLTISAQVASESGGFPWLIVGGGGAAAVLVTCLLVCGGDPPIETGSISTTFPSGSVFRRLQN